MDNKVHSYEVLHLVGLSTHRNTMHGTHNVKSYYHIFAHQPTNFRTPLLLLFLEKVVKKIFLETFVTRITFHNFLAGPPHFYLRSFK